MKFIHMADMHLDAPFKTLADGQEFGKQRRIEQRQIFKELINNIKKENIPFLFISGDFYEQQYIRLNTIEYINNLFKEIPETKIFISPGNHDPLIKNSIYNNFNWNENVYIFNNEIKCYEFEDADIYGFGFTDFYCTSSDIENIKIKNPNKINILITHGSIDTSITLEKQYNPINSKKISQIGFDYVALGHIHKASYEQENLFIYPGSINSFGFDELGEHGALIVEINKLNNKINKKINFIKLDPRIFEEINLDISEINSEEELIEKIINLNLNKNNYYKLILIGKRNYIINNNKNNNNYELINLIKKNNIKNILKIKNNTKINYDLEKLASQKTLKGIFVSEIISKLADCQYDKEQLYEALEIGLEAIGQ